MLNLLHLHNVFLRGFLLLSDDFLFQLIDDSLTLVDHGINLVLLVSHLSDLSFQAI
jgi:hypothetical protein